MKVKELVKKIGLVKKNEVRITITEKLEKKFSTTLDLYEANEVFRKYDNRSIGLVTPGVADDGKVELKISVLPLE